MISVQFSLNDEKTGDRIEHMTIRYPSKGEADEFVAKFIYALHGGSLSAVRCNPQYPHRVLVDASEGRVWTIEIVQ